MENSYYNNYWISNTVNSRYIEAGYNEISVDNFVIRNAIRAISFVRFSEFRVVRVRVRFSEKNSVLLRGYGRKTIIYQGSHFNTGPLYYSIVGTVIIKAVVSILGHYSIV